MVRTRRLPLQKRKMGNCCCVSSAKSLRQGRLIQPKTTGQDRVSLVLPHSCLRKSAPPMLQSSLSILSWLLEYSEANSTRTQGPNYLRKLILCLIFISSLIIRVSEHTKFLLNSFQTTLPQNFFKLTPGSLKKK